jgi:chromosome segregation ATPase
MSDYQKQITELDRSISEHEAHIGTLHAQLGNYVRNQRDDLIEQKRLRTKAKEAEARQKEFDEASSRAARLEHLQNRRQEIQEQISDAQAEAERLSEEIKPLCREVGEAAFKTYKENPFVDPAIEEVFAGLLEHHEELKELERQISEQESEMGEKSAVTKLMSRGRLAFLKGKKSARENALPKLYREAGEAICATNFISRVEDPELSKTAKPFFQKQAEIEDLERQIQSLEDEKRTVQQELQEITSGLGTERRLKRSKEAAEEELRETERAIGEKTAATLEEDAELPEEIRSVLSERAELQKQLKQERNRLRRLKAAVELEEVTQSISRIDERIKAVEEEIDERKQRLASLKQDLENARAEERRLEKARGSVEDL